MIEPTTTTTTTKIGKIAEPPHFYPNVHKKQKQRERERKSRNGKNDNGGIEERKQFKKIDLSHRHTLVHSRANTQIDELRIESENKWAVNWFNFRMSHSDRVFDCHHFCRAISRPHSYTAISFALAPHLLPPHISFAHTQSTRIYFKNEYKSMSLYHNYRLLNLTKTMCVCARKRERESESARVIVLPMAVTIGYRMHQTISYIYQHILLGRNERRFCLRSIFHCEKGSPVDCYVFVRLKVCMN